MCVLYSGGAGLTVFSCGESQTYCGLVGSGGADTHKDRLSHFSFFLAASSFCICFLSLLSASLSQQSTVCSNFLHTRV